MFLNHTPRHVRFVAAPPEGGMASGGADQPAASSESEDVGEPIDWEAKYMTEQEKAAKHVKELEDKVASYETAKQRAEWKAQASAETGVPADVIEGDSLEAMQSHAKRIHELLNPKPKAPAVHGADRQPSGKGPNESMVNYLRNLGL